MDRTGPVAPSASRIGHRGWLLAAAALLATTLAEAPAAMAARHSHAVSAVTTNSLSLTAQSPAAVAPGKAVTVGLAVRSPLPSARLGLKLFVYSRVENDSTFDTLPTLPSEEVPATGALSLNTNRSAPTNGSETVVVGVSEGASTTPTTRPTISVNQGDGVYPVTVALVDKARGDVVLSSLTTHLVVVSASAAVPLRVGLVLPIGATNALRSSRTAELTRRTLTALAAETNALNSHPGTSLSLDVYSQLLVALSGATNDNLAAARAMSLSSTVARGVTRGNLELLRTPFAPLNVSALSAAGAAEDLSGQFLRSARLTAGFFPKSVTVDSGAPYVTEGRLSAAGLALLRSAGDGELVVPASQAHFPLQFLQTAPFSLLSPGKTTADATTPLALPTYPALDDTLSAPGTDPVLAGHELLAKLAQVYFDFPALPQPRAIVVAPAALPSDPTTLRTLLDTVLGGLTDNPILTTSTVSGIFSDVAAGSNGEEWNASSAPLQPTGTFSPLPEKAIAGAHKALSTYMDIATGDSGRQTRLQDVLYLSESSSLSEGQRRRYADVVAAILPEFRASLSFSSSRRIALTSRQGKFPVTIKVGWLAPGPIDVRLRLSSAGDALTFPGITGHSELLSLVSGGNAENIAIAARASGAFDLTLELDSPSGSVVLLRSSGFSVRSTAISGAAIGLSVAALAVLLAWWIRSIRRSRRRKAANATEALTAE